MRVQLLGLTTAIALLLGTTLPAQSHGHCGGGGFHSHGCGIPHWDGGCYRHIPVSVGFGFGTCGPYYGVPYYPPPIVPSVTVMPSFASTSVSNVFYKSPYNTHSYSPLLVKAQTQLKKLGYYKARIDGHFGPATQKAIETFQRENDLPVTGRLNNKTLQHLKN